MAGAELEGRHSYVPEWVTLALGDEIDDDFDEWVVLVMRRGMIIMLIVSRRLSL